MFTCLIFALPLWIIALCMKFACLLDKVSENALELELDPYTLGVRQECTLGRRPVLAIKTNRHTDMLLGSRRTSESTEETHTDMVGQMGNWIQIVTQAQDLATLVWSQLFLTSAPPC